jgi:tRNA(fMet)-specific endonuclease VapC
LSFHLDTNIVVGMLNDRRPEYRERFEQVRAYGENVAVSSVVIFELWYGIAHSKRVEQNAGGLRLFLDRLTTVLPFSIEDAIAAGEIRASLQKAGTPIGPYDLLIAAHAVRLGATLVTANAREFARVPGLKIEDWTT